MCWEVEQIEQFASVVAFDFCIQNTKYFSISSKEVDIRFK